MVNIDPTDWMTSNPSENYERLKTRLESLRNNSQNAYFSNGERLTLTILVPDATQDTNSNSISVPYPIKLPRQVDFNGWTIEIITEDNPQDTDDRFLFKIGNTSDEGHKNFHITKDNIESGDFTSCPELASGKKLLFLTDKTIWASRTDTADNRDIYRKDLLIIENGKALNRPISSYNNSTTALYYSYYDIENDTPICIKNLKFIRNYNNKYIVKLINIANNNDITIENIETTIEGNKQDHRTGDSCFRFVNCSNVVFRRITINETFSSEGNYGYGIALDNVYNSFFYDVNGTATWGIMGNYFINRMYLYKCRLNRLDVHTYGRDIRCYECTFVNDKPDTNHIYNQFSGFFGSLHYQDCTFIDFIPVLLEPSYDAYTGFDLYMCDCTMKHPSTSSRSIQNTIVRTGFIVDSANKREELRTTCWPNIHISNLKLCNYPSSTQLHLFFLWRVQNNNSANAPVHYLSQVYFSMPNHSNAVVFLNGYINPINNIARLTAHTIHNFPNQ